MLLRELEAFEACWFDLKDTYPTSRQDNTLIAHAMGQLVDLIEKPDQVERSLPDHLKILFRRLAIAYFQGYIPHPVPPTQPSFQKPPVEVKLPTAHLQQQEISAAVAQVRVLARQAQARIGQPSACQTSGASTGCAIQEMDTLIIDFPAHWTET